MALLIFILAIPIKLKLDEWKLQEDEQPINWSYEISKNFIRFEHDSLGRFCYIERSLIG